jgi:hypothetical protein
MAHLPAQSCPDIAAMDFYVVPTIGFDLLYAFVIVRLDGRDLVWINVTRNPTAEWVARQITEAFPWDGAPGYMIRDRDRIYGTIVTLRLRAMGIRDKPTVPASPWQNGFAERLIGSIRRECLDHIVVFCEAHLRRILRSYARYYNEIRTHRSLDKMRRFLARFSGPEASNRSPSSADSTTTMPEFRFSVHTGGVPVQVYAVERLGKEDVVVANDEANSTFRVLTAPGLQNAIGDRAYLTLDLSHAHLFAACDVR